MIFKQLIDAETSTYTYLLADEWSREAVIIDSVTERVERDFQLVTELGLTLVAVLDTHIHADHITGSAGLSGKTGATIVVPKGSDVVGADRFVGEGSIIPFGRQALRVLETPGHTANCISFVLDKQAVFTGDALLIRGTGRTDFQGGDARNLYNSIQKLFALPDDLMVYPGHDYNGHTASSIAEEKRYNPRLAGKSEREFVDLMAQLKLPLPRRIQQSVPANRICGRVLPGGWEVTPAQVFAHGQDMVLLDVRSQEEMAGPLGHVAKARWVGGSLKSFAEKVGEKAVVITLCRSGKRSLSAAVELRKMGLETVWSMAGGMLAWREQQLPVAGGQQ